jgi:hypothetical protein
MRRNCPGARRTLRINQCRSNRKGSMLTLMCVSIALLALMGLVAFNLLDTYNLQGYHEQPLQSAALSTAAELSRVVINDPNFGYVALVDYAPTGGSLVASDQYSVPVRGINSLFATIRVDMIIADVLGDSTLMTLAQDDYKNALVTATNLASALSNAVSSDGSNKPKDVNGNTADIYSDALAIYLGNGGSAVDKSAFSIKLGTAYGLSSNTPIPAPSTFANVTADQSVDNEYDAFMSIPYGNKTFVFDALAASPTLIESVQFSPGPGKLVGVVPDVVQINGIVNNSGAKLTGTVYAIPGATPVNPLAQGALALTFPDGNIPEMTTFGQILRDQTFTNMAFIPGLVTGGDYPGGSATITSPAGPLPSWMGTSPSASNILSLLFYDWLRRAGPTVQIDSVQSMMLSAISPNPSELSPFMEAFSANNGVITSQCFQLEQHYAQSADSQLVAGLNVNNNTGVSYNCLVSKSRVALFDMQICDNVRQPGTLKGGLHAGEPLVDVRLTSNPIFPDPNYTDPTNENTGTITIDSRDGWAGKSGGWAYMEWNAPTSWVGSNDRSILNWPYPLLGGDNTPEVLKSQPVASQSGSGRPSYTTPSLAVEIAFHRNIWANPRTTN